MFLSLKNISYQVKDKTIISNLSLDIEKKRLSYNYRSIW